MSQPYIGEIRMFAGNFAPAGWAFCQGQLMPISENEAMFQLIGTTYGGDGQETFGLPNLASRVPIHMGQGVGLSNYVLAENGGTENVTLTTNQIPVHNHQLLATSTGQQASPANAFPAVASGPGLDLAGVYAPPDTNVPMSVTVSPMGGNQPHDNMIPFLVINFIISLFGIFPSQT